MTRDRSTFAKHQRELEKKRKAEARRTRQQQEKSPPQRAVGPAPGEPPVEKSNA